MRPVRFESESRIICKFPRRLSSGVLRVRVTNNNQDYTSDRVVFTFYHPLVVDYATPLVGLIDELTTQILLVGHSFHGDADLVCGFQDKGNSGRSFVDATLVSTSTMTCTLPTPGGLYPRNSSASISTSLQIREATQQKPVFEAPFQYIARPVPLSVFPKLVLTTGGQTLTIEGSDLASGIDIFCQFDSYYPYDKTPFTQLNGTHGSCRTPERPPGPVEVRLCLRYQNQCSHESLTVSYVRTPIVRELAPNAQSEAEGFSITVIGKYFYNAPMSCAFDGVKTPATFTNQSAVACPTPALVRLMCSKFLFYVDGVEVMGKPLDYCTQMGPFGELDPSSHWSGEWGNARLSEWRTLSSGYWVCLRVWESEYTGRVPVDVANLLCITPSRALSVPFSVAGQYYSSIRLTFTYQPAPVATGIAPSRGSELGQYQAIISGSKFIRGAGLRCQFGVSDVVAAKWISEASISCVVPPHSPGWVDVQVTNNLQDYSVQGVRFEYVVSPVVLGFEPTKVYAQDEDNIVLHGRDFRNSSDVRCIIGNELTEAAFLSSTKLKCGAATLVETSVVIGVLDLSLSTVGAFADKRLVVQDDGVWSLSPRVTSARGETLVTLSRLSGESLEFGAIYGRFCTRNRSICSELIPTDYVRKNQLRWLPRVGRVRICRGWLMFTG